MNHFRECKLPELNTFLNSSIAFSSVILDIIFISFVSPDFDLTSVATFFQSSYQIFLQSSLEISCSISFWFSFFMDTSGLVVVAISFPLNAFNLRFMFLCFMHKYDCLIAKSAISKYDGRTRTNDEKETLARGFSLNVY